MPDASGSTFSVNTAVVSCPTGISNFSRPNSYIFLSGACAETLAQTRSAPVRSIRGGLGPLRNLPRRDHPSSSATSSPKQGKAAEIVRQQFHTELHEVSITATDGTPLRAWYIQPNHFNGDEVILLHGVTDNREGVAGFAPMFLNQGYTVLLPDARAHGESGGAIATYGLKERYDIRQWSAWLKQHSKGCVYLFGESMGAAIAAQATEVTPDLCAIAVESPFSTFREIAYDRMAEHSPFGTWFWRTAGRPLIEIALAYARWHYDVDLTQADPERAMEHSTVPTLLIAGTADRNIPMRHSAELMRTSASHAALWIVNGADHGGAVTAAGPQEFQRRILDWFQQHHAPPARFSAAHPKAGPPATTKR